MTELETIRLKNWYDKCAPEYGDFTSGMEKHILQDYVDTQGDVAGEYIQEAEQFLMFVKDVYFPCKTVYRGANFKGTYFDFLLHMWNDWDSKYKNNWLLEK
jgi:hypothetical protein